MRLKRYDDFVNEEWLSKALIGGAIGASSLLPAHSSTPNPTKPPRDTTSQATNNMGIQELIEFADTIESERPDLFTDKTMTDGTRLNFGQYERLDFLKKHADDYQSTTGVNLNLDILTHKSNLFPFNINYFMVRGLDDIDNGPVLIQILRLDYTAAINIAGHDVMFNFTRVQDVNTFGARVNF